ncbi:MAG: DUF1592 domain-containing protein [Pirellulales bacterium]|nr:DUF1592 domain-containing protein [Pirellulales bacterium]
MIVITPQGLCNRRVPLVQKLLHKLCKVAIGLVAVLPGIPVVAEISSFESRIEPLLKKLCYDCHGDGASEGGLQFDVYGSVEELVANRQLWGPVWDNLLTETMPPADMPQPTRSERKTLSDWIARQVFGIDPMAPDPGRVTIRRLNREEYRYSVYDLLGVDFPVYDHFPADDTGYGFDTIGDVLTVPPPLMEKYFSAAEEIVSRIADPRELQPSKKNAAMIKAVFFDGAPPAEPGKRLKYARRIIEQLAERAFRRPVEETIVEKLVSLSTTDLEEEDASFEAAVGRALVAILVSPRFLYRAELQPAPDDPRQVHPLDEYALAARLSYFLWSSIPDRQLFDLAEQGQLRAELPQQVTRMMADPKSNRFVENFVGQWLRTRNVEGIFKAGDLRQQLGHLRPAMRRETEMLFAHVMRSDCDVIDLIAADYTFLDERLAEFYGIPGVEGKTARLVKLPADSPRGGVLAHAGVLLVTSSPNRTSPVKRGRFILDNILGTPALPPPPEVPAIEESIKGVTWKMSVREQLALHREDPVCASCHDRMDPLGLGMENFDAIGRWRDTDDGEPIDSSGQLASGEEFSGIGELRKILVGKRRLFYRCLTRKMMIYAIGRGIEYTDTPTIESIVDAMIDGKGRFSTMLLAVIQSPQFQSRRGGAAGAPRE